MTGANTFDWSVLDEALAGAEEKAMHVILRVFAHYPGKPLRVPHFLLQEIDLHTLGNGELSPQYDDPMFLSACRKFIQALGARYDGHKSLAFIQLGLLGKWGEWHTYPDTGLLSDGTKDLVMGWYNEAFRTTPLQVRNPQSAYEAGMGLHDDSFGYSTLDGAPNGGETVDWFFWREVQDAGQQDFWKTGVMGGESRPELQSSIFSNDYQARTPYHQDFMECVDVTHATYMFHHNAFVNGQPYSGSKLENALDAHVGMGYSYQVNKVAAKAESNGKLTVDVTVEQTGVAPFYYPLDLVFRCNGTKKSVSGVEQLVDNGDSRTFTFSGIPADSCLERIEILLDSEHVHSGRPVRFAQGNDGRVIVNIPLPQSGENIPSVAGPSIFVNSGPEGEDRSIVTGDTWENYSPVSISNYGDYNQEIFKTHRWGSSFAYTFSGLTPGSWKDVTLGFAETYEEVCKGNVKRVFAVSVNGKKFARRLNIFRRAGCKTAFTKTKPFRVDANGKLVIVFVAKRNNAMVSFILIENAIH